MVKFSATLVMTYKKKSINFKSYWKLGEYLSEINNGP